MVVPTCPSKETSTSSVQGGIGSTLMAEGETRLGGVGPAHQRVERPVEGLRGGGGQEADPTEVDAQDRRLGAVERAGPAQQGTVAAECDQAVELGCAMEWRGPGLRPERR